MIISGWNRIDNFCIAFDYVFTIQSVLHRYIEILIYLRLNSTRCAPTKTRVPACLLISTIILMRPHKITFQLSEAPWPEFTRVSVKGEERSTAAKLHKIPSSVVSILFLGASRPYRSARPADFHLISFRLRRTRATSSSLREKSIRWSDGDSVALSSARSVSIRFLSFHRREKRWASPFHGRHDFPR